MQQPWDGFISDSDVLGFREDTEFNYRPIAAGTRPALVVIDMTRVFVDSKWPAGWSEKGYPAAA